MKQQYSVKNYFVIKGGTDQIQKFWGTFCAINNFFGQKRGGLDQNKKKRFFTICLGIMTQEVPQKFQKIVSPLKRGGGVKPGSENTPIKAA